MRGRGGGGGKEKLTHVWGRNRREGRGEWGEEEEKVGGERKCVGVEEEEEEV